MSETKLEQNKRKELETLFREHGYSDFKWIDPQKIIVSQWVRMKCMFGCKEYGKNSCCPPNTPPVPECEKFFSEYGSAVIFHFKKRMEDPEERHKWTKTVNAGLSKLERQVFIKGYQKAFLLFMDSCTLCGACVSERGKCKQPESARPGPEAMAIDVFATVRQYGLPIAVLSDYAKEMNRYAILLIQ